MALMEGDLPTAISYWQQAKKHFQRLGDHHSHNTVQQWISDAEIALRDPTSAT